MILLFSLLDLVVEVAARVEHGQLPAQDGYIEIEASFKGTGSRDRIEIFGRKDVLVSRSRTFQFYQNI